jgi:hypothetical protein
VRLLYTGRSVRMVGSPRPRRTVLAPRLAATVTSNTSIRLDWVFQDSQDADLIVLEQSVDNAIWSSLTTTAASTSGSYDVTGLDADTCYYFRARGKINYGASSSLISGNSSVVARVTSDSSINLTIPVNLAVTETARDAYTQTVTVSWDAVPNADGYFYWLAPSEDGGFEDGDTDDPLPSSNLFASAELTRSTDDDICELHVIPLDETEGRGPEAEFQFVIPGNLKPPILQPLVQSGVNVVISYVEDANADSAISYCIERDSGDGFERIATIAAGTPAPQYTNADPGEGTHSYRVQGLDDTEIDDETEEVIERLGSFSVTRSITIDDDDPVPPDFEEDFEAMTSYGDLDASWTNRAPQNIVFDDGSLTAFDEVGLLFRYVQRATHCADQALFLERDVPAQFEVWTEQTAVISSSFTTVNTNCSVIPNYKLQIGHLLPSGSQLTGRPRWELQMGQGLEARNMGATGTGYPTLAAEAEATNPIAFLAPSPVDATSLWDGERHVFRTYWRLFQQSGVWKETMIASTDGNVTHSWTAFAGNPGSGSLGRLSLGGARSQGAEVEMYIHQKQYRVWYEGNDPGWFTGIIPTDYT